MTRRNEIIFSMLDEHDWTELRGNERSTFGPPFVHCSKCGEFVTSFARPTLDIEADLNQHSNQHVKLSD